MEIFKLKTTVQTLSKYCFLLEGSHSQKYHDGDDDDVIHFTNISYGHELLN